MYIADIYIVERNYGLVVCGFLFTTLAVIAVILRLITRLALVRNFGIDDAFITLAAVSFTPLR
jgi:high-affinity Fe2+/Pb2+ permease